MIWHVAFSGKVKVRSAIFFKAYVHAAKIVSVQHAVHRLIAYTYCGHITRTTI